MSSKQKVSTGTSAPGRSRKKLLLAAVPIVLLLALAGLWFAGLVPVPGLGAHAESVARPAGEPAKPLPVFFDIPEIVTNLNAGPRRTSFLKLQAKLELADPADRIAAAAALPRVLDLFQTYMREMRPDELHGSSGTYRLRQELTARANLAIAPAHVVDVLFVELLVQ